MSFEPKCPHCRAEFDVAGTELYLGHTTYWGDEEPAEIDCPHCEKPLFLKEHVIRFWTAGATPEAAADA